VAAFESTPRCSLLLQARNEKRGTISWNDFSSTGFSRSDDPLSATLQFAAPLTTTISAWPTRQSEIRHKLKKTQKALPAFGWDTTPVLSGEEAIEEGFVGVFCDLLYGSGWIDRWEQTFRECNWALVSVPSLSFTLVVIDLHISGGVQVHAAVSSKWTDFCGSSHRDINLVI
jgi:hypothetical protein